MPRDGRKENQSETGILTGRSISGEYMGVDKMKIDSFKILHVQVPLEKSWCVLFVKFCFR